MLGFPRLRSTSRCKLPASDSRWRRMRRFLKAVDKPDTSRGSHVTVAREHGTESYTPGREPSTGGHGVRSFPESITSPRGPSRASPLRPPPRAPYLDFSIGDGCQIFGIPGDGCGPDAIAFWAAVKYCVHRNAAKQDQGTRFEVCLAPRRDSFQKLWRKQMCSIHTTDCNAAIQRKEARTPAVSGVDPHTSREVEKPDTKTTRCSSSLL